MKNCSISVAPIVESDKFDLSQYPKNEFEWKHMKNVPYASTIGSLMYARVCTRSDIAFSIRVFERYHSNPSIDH